MHPVALRAAARIAVVLAVLAGVTLLVGCGALGQIGTPAHTPPAQAFTVGGRVTAVVIDGGSGSVDVTGSARSTVSVSQHASYSRTPPKAVHGLHGTTLTLSYTCPAELECAVSYQVRVPRGVAVTVSTSAGAVTLTALAGRVSARATAGLVTAVDLRSAVASFNSDAGGVVAAFSAVPASLTASTKVGPISLTVPAAAAYRVSTHTVVGTATVTVRRSSSTAHSITARSDLGSVSVSPA